MRGHDYYLGEGEFTRYKDQPNVQRIASQIKGDYLSGIEEYVSSLIKTNSDIKQTRLTGKRPAEVIIKDGFAAGFSDSCHLFVTLARAKGIPAAFVETIEIRKGKCRIMRPFADVYTGMDWWPRNPGYGKVSKENELYVLESTVLPNMSKRKFVEIARGLDLSELWDRSGNKISLKSKKDFDILLESKECRELLMKYPEFTQSPHQA